MNLLQLEFVATFASPSIPLGFGWWKLLHTRSDATWATRIAAILSSISLFWLLLEWPFHWMLGPDYSKLRYGLIEGNLVLMIAAGALAVLGRGKGRWLIAFASILVGALWFFVGAINSVV
jgi:hypothetical protein